MYSVRIPADVFEMGSSARWRHHLTVLAASFCGPNSSVSSLLTLTRIGKRMSILKCGEQKRLMSVLLPAQ
jgi:hypothetical protein